MTFPRGLRLAIVLAGVVALLWPARWGGLFGMTMVAGDSMEPGMRSGDIAVTMRQPSYSEGDPIVFEMPGLEHRYVIHRIVRTDADGRFVTQGDNRETGDNWRVDPADVVGEQMLVIHRCEHPLCRNLSLPVLFGIGLLGIAAGLWIYAVVRGPRRREGAFVPDPGRIPRSGEGVALATIVSFADERCATSETTVQPILDSEIGRLVALRVSAVTGADPREAGVARSVSEHALCLREAAGAAGAADLVVLAADPDLDRLVEALDESEDLRTLAIELPPGALADRGARRMVQRLTSRGARLVLSGLRSGLIGNRRALFRTLDRHGADAAVADLGTCALQAACSAVEEVGAVLVIGVSTAHELETLHEHGLEWWSGPLASPVVPELPSPDVPDGAQSLMAEDLVSTG
jgi:signal peptidase I